MQRIFDAFPVEISIQIHRNGRHQAYAGFVESETIPINKLEGLVETLQQAEKNGRSYRQQTRGMMPDFPQPSFYKELFKKWGLDTE